MAFELVGLPAPDVLETLDYDTVFGQVLAQFRTRYPQYSSIIEGDPGYSVLQAMAWQETMTRKRINDAARALLVTHATGADLDNLGALFAVTRQIVTAADPDADPPIAEVLETDVRLRDRIINTLEAIVPGSQAWYRNYALEADSRVHEAIILKTDPGEVTVYVQGIRPDTVPTAAILTAVREYLNEDERRFICDTVIVAAVGTVSYTVTATVEVKEGFVASEVLAKVKARFTEFVEAREVVGKSIPLSAIYDAMVVEEVEAINLTAPSADVTVTNIQVPVLQGTAGITIA